MRKIYLDQLRIIATIAVVVLHVAAGLLYQYKQLPLNEWFIANFFDSITRWCVPVFIMISGALLLGKQEKLGLFLTKRISKVVIPFLAWSILYFMFNCLWLTPELKASQFLSDLLNGDVYYHLWFMYMIIGLYLLVPMLRVFIQHTTKNLLHYTLALWFIYMTVSWFLRYFTSIEFALKIPPYSEYLGYLLLGYYLDKFDFSKRLEKLIYLLTIGSFLSIVIGTYVETNLLGYFGGAFYSYFCPFVTITATGLFLFVKNRTRTIFTPLLKINKASLGVYLIHPLIIILVEQSSQINNTFIHPLVGIPLMSILTVSISTFVILFLQKLPLLKHFAP